MSTNRKNEMQETSKKDIVSAFAHEWAICAGAKSILHIKASSFDILPHPHKLKWQEFKAVQDIPANARYDLILGELPFSMRTVAWNNGNKTIKIQQNWLELLKCLGSLETNGTALFLLEPLGFSTSKGLAFEKELNERGFFVNAFINFPEKMLLSETVVTPILVVLSKKQTKQLFVAELLDYPQAQDVARGYFSNINKGDLTRGKYIDIGDFSGFYRIKIKEQIEHLETQYKTFKEYSLGELAVEINYAKSGEQLTERDNAIYVPKIGNSQVISRLEDAKIKHHNYYQIVLGELAINEYVASFFRSTLGRLVLDSLTSRTFIPHLNKKDIEQAIVALPELNEQKAIAHTHKKLHDLKNAINGFDAEIALNPTSSSSILSQLDMLIDAIGKLTDVDKVRAIVREGETKYVEFKETLSLNVKNQTNKKDKNLEIGALKTVVAFLNTDGGKLLIGVSDDGKITGLDAEIDIFYKNTDQFLLHWTNLLRDQIGEKYHPFINHRMIHVDAKHVLLVECDQSRIPCYLNKRDFYIRINPASKKLDVPDAVEYVQSHFK